MQPSRLNLDANSSSASKEWCHWFLTFENYIEVFDASLAGERRTNKLKALVNCVSHRVFEYIADCDLYDGAITVLRNLYKKAPNEVFIRHLLATAKQRPEETLDEFYLKLQKFARDCNFRQVTSEQYRQETVRDTLINGLSSHGIHQRLLENCDLNFENAVEKACSMELSQKIFEFYSLNQECRSNLTATIAHKSSTLSTTDNVTAGYIEREKIVNLL